MKDFRKLEIWKRSFNLVLVIYDYTENFPKQEMYGLTAQIRRCSVSIPSNISEGCGKNSIKDLAKFVDIALGSSFELETQLLICKKLKYSAEDQVIKLNTNP